MHGCCRHVVCLLEEQTEWSRWRRRNAGGTHNIAVACAAFGVEQCSLFEGGINCTCACGRISRGGKDEAGGTSRSVRRNEVDAFRRGRRRRAVSAVRGAPNRADGGSELAVDGRKRDSKSKVRAGSWRERRGARRRRRLSALIDGGPRKGEEGGNLKGNLAWSSSRLVPI